MKFSERRALVAAMRSDTAHEHFVQFYEDDAVLLASVSAFIGGSIAAGGGGFVVATEAHLASVARASALGRDLGGVGIVPTVDDVRHAAGELMRRAPQC